MKPDETESKDKGQEGERLLVSNLPYGATYEAIVEKLSASAKILDMHVPVTSEGKNKGWGIFRVPNGQGEKLLDATILLEGRILRLQRAK
jgi:hypothetical protein